MKTVKVLFIIFSLAFWSCNCFADSSQFQVRLVLDEKEMEVLPHDVFSYTSPRGQKIGVAVAKDIILSVEDVQDASIELQEDLLKNIPNEYWTIGSDGYKVLRYTQEDKLNLTAEPRIDFNLTETGKKKFLEFTEHNLRKSAALIGDNRILAKVTITAPISGGRIQIFSPTNKVNEMVKLVESMGLRLKVKPSAESGIILFHFVADKNNPNAFKMVTADGKEELYLEHIPQFTLADVYSARIEPIKWSPEALKYYKSKGLTPNASQILIEFTQQGKAKLYLVTSKNINRRLGVIINGQLVIAPLIKEPISMGEISIQGSMSEEEMKALVEHINKAKGR